VVALHSYLDKRDSANFEHKLQTFSAVYRKLTGKDAVFTFKAASDRSF